MSNDIVQLPSGFEVDDVVAWGTTGIVLLDGSSNTVIKIPFNQQDSFNLAALDREQQIYELFNRKGGHKGILSYHGALEHGTLGSGFRLEYAANHSLRSYNKYPHITFEQRLQWAIQIAEAMVFFHTMDVIHGDLTLPNILLDKNANAKIADFAGSSLRGSPLLVCVTTSYQYPGPLDSIQGDIFAFGCLLFELITGNPPYGGLLEKDIRIRYQKGQFPNVESMQSIGSVIGKCWKGEYGQSNAIVQDLRAIKQENTLDLWARFVKVSIAATLVVAATFLLNSRQRWGRRP